MIEWKRRGISTLPSAQERQEKAKIHEVEGKKKRSMKTITTQKTALEKVKMGQDKGGNHVVSTKNYLRIKKILFLQKPRLKKTAFFMLKF